MISLKWKNIFPKKQIKPKQLTLSEIVLVYDFLHKRKIPVQDELTISGLVCQCSEAEINAFFVLLYGVDCHLLSNLDLVEITLTHALRKNDVVSFASFLEKSHG